MPVACCLLSPCQEQPDIYDPVVSAPRNRQAYRKSIFFIHYWDFVATVHPDYGVPVNVAYAHHDNNRNVPDNWL